MNLPLQLQHKSAGLDLLWMTLLSVGIEPRPTLGRPYTRNDRKKIIDYAAEDMLFPTI